MSAISQQLFISLKGHLVLLGKDDDPELLLYDPGIRAHLRVYQVLSRDHRKQTSSENTRSPSLLSLVHFAVTLENFISQSSNKSVLSYFNIHTKDAVYKNGTQEKMDSLCFNADSSLCIGGSLNGSLFVWNTFNGEMIAKVKVGPSGIRQLLLDW